MLLPTNSWYLTEQFGKLAGKTMTTKKSFLCLFFGCFGIACEIFFVAFTHLYTQVPLWDEPLWSLTGKTYVWMFPIYALIPIIGGAIMDKVQKYPLLVRLLIYSIGIYIIEFISGFLLELITGKCPWEYTSGWQVMGYIRLDYFPYWILFSFIIERLYLYLNKKL